MKIKIIDLLNKIANGEDTPNELKYGGLTFIKNNIGFYQDEDGFNLTAYICHDYSNLNDEIELIEEPKEVELPNKLDYKYKNTYGNTSQCKHSEIRIIDTINGLISYLKAKEANKEGNK